VSADTRARLIDGSLTALRTHGIAGVSARTIAKAAGVNQALVFYHFGTVDQLLAEACRSATQARVAAYRHRFAAVTSMRELLDVGRDLHAQERAEGNVGVLAQLLAGAQSDPGLAPAIADALALWTAEIERVIVRLLARSPIADLADPAGLARAVSAAFVGLELFEGVDEPGTASAFLALERLAVLAEVVDDLGPIARRALQAKLRTHRG
jgi:AcrR family transcriptional regulator